MPKTAIWIALLLLFPVMVLADALPRRSIVHPSGVTHASWYGPRFAGRRTASGQPFNPTALTAAHRTLPLGSDVRVTNLRNGRRVVVRINDRGPYVRGRGIDVSREAARRLDMVEAGVVPVHVEILSRSRTAQPTFFWRKPTAREQMLHP